MMGGDERFCIRSSHVHHIWLQRHCTEHETMSLIFINRSLQYTPETNRQLTMIFKHLKMMRLLTCFLPRTPTTRHKINKMVPSRFAPRIAAISATFPNATQFYFYAPISTYKPPASFEPTEKPWAGVNTKKTDSYS